jgi:hypothetical protein
MSKHFGMANTKNIINELVTNSKNRYVRDAHRHQ